MKQSGILCVSEAVHEIFCFLSFFVVLAIYLQGVVLSIESGLKLRYRGRLRERE